MKITFLPAFLKTNSPTAAKRFKLVKNFSIISVGGFAIAIFLLSALYRQQAQRDLLLSTEENHVALTQVLSNTLWPEYGQYLFSIRSLDDQLLLSDTTVRQANQRVAATVEGSKVKKVKVFDVNGRVILSTDASQIGLDKSQSSGFLATQSGEIVSQINHRGISQATDGKSVKQYLLSSYIPIRSGNFSGKVIGAFEVYTDVTSTQHRIHLAQRTIILSSALVLTVLYGILLLFIRRADYLLSHQYQQVLESEDRYRLQTDKLEKTLANLKQTQSQLIQSEKMSSLGQLVAGIAHEINNPVNFITGNVYLAEQYASDLLSLVEEYQKECETPSETIKTMTEEIDLAFLAEDFPRLLSSIKAGAQRITQIVTALRTFSHLDESDRKPVALNLGIESTLMILQHRLKAQSVRPKIEVFTDFRPLPLIDCAPHALNQAFMNILINAIDALDEHYASLVNNQSSQNLTVQPKLACDWSPQIKISTELSSTQEVTVTIADNGSGIPQNIQDRIFDPFFTTKPVGKGTGLGLSTSHTIVTQQHGGRLTVISSQQGTKFVIKLPL